MPQSSGTRRTSVGVLFWIAFILLVLVIFLANRSNIEQVLESTGIVEVVRDRFSRDEEAPPAASDTLQPDSAPAPSADGAPVAGDEPVANDERPASDDPRVVIEPSGDTEPATEDPEAPHAAPPARNEPSAQPTTPTEPAPSAQRAPSPDPEKPNRMMAGLYFIKVTDDGRTYPQRVVRAVYYATSPLTETIEALIGGPSGDQLDDGLLNLIPDGTRLISAHVQGGTAFLNFNQSFRFNPLGAEGTVAQLLQIIYSSTEFPTVERVQFLVEGEEIDYLGGDGIYVGEPLGRDAFSS